MKNRVVYDFTQNIAIGIGTLELNLLIGISNRIEALLDNLFNIQINTEW